MYVEGNEDDHSHQPYAEADKRVRSEAGQIQAVRSESHRIRPVGRQPCRIHRCEAASRPFLGRGRIQTGFAPAKERNTMSNILTDNTRTRRLAASVLAGVVLLGGMAGLSGTAMAAGAGTITLTAPADETLANHTFSAYKIGDYSGYADANANGKIDSTNVTNAASRSNAEGKSPADTGKRTFP